MLSEKLNNLAQNTRNHGATGAPIAPYASLLLADVLADLAERVAILEHQPAPPSANVVQLRQVAA
jgi:hypothetical protein